MTTCVMTFPGRPESAAAARRWASRCLPGCPAAADVMVCVSELVTNSVLHSRSGLVPGGQVRVRISCAPGVWVRVEVRDDGPVDWSPAGFRDSNGATASAAAAVTEPGELAETGRGLRLVRELSGGDAGTDGCLQWARLTWSPAPAAAAPWPWGMRWLSVMERARWRCECSGQCGRAGHRCPVGHAPGYPLHVVPAVPAGDAAAAALPASDLVALCGSCRTGAEKAAGRAAAATAPPPDALFAPGGGAG